MNNLLIGILAAMAVYGCIQKALDLSVQNSKEAEKKEKELKAGSINTKVNLLVTIFRNQRDSEMIEHRIQLFLIVAIGLIVLTAFVLSKSLS